jgi:hypothetical protein
VKTARIRNTLTDLGWSLAILTGLCVAGAAALAAIYLGGVR